MARERAQRGGELRGRLAGGDGRGDMRGKLFFKKPACLVDWLARAHLALDSLQHGARWSGGRVRGELGQRRVGRDARA